MNWVFPILVVLCCVAILASWGRKEQIKPPIIDFHMHAGKLTRPVQHLVFKEMYSPATTEAFKKETFEMMEELNVYGYMSGEVDIIMDFYKSNPERIFPCFYFENIEKFDLNILRQDLEEKKWVVIGEVLNQYEGIAPSDPIMDPIYSLAEEFDVPLAAHVGMGPPGGSFYLGIKDYRCALSNPILYEEALIRHPKMRICLMHAGWPMLDSLICLMDSHPQVYVDTAWISWGIPQKEFYYYLKRIVEAGFGNRVLFGSDQIIWPEGMRMAINSILYAPFLSEEQKRGILYNNAARFMKLSEETIRKHHGK